MDFEKRWSTIIKKREILGFDTNLCILKSNECWYISQTNTRFSELSKAYNLKDLLDEEDKKLNKELEILVNILGEKIGNVMRLLPNDSTPEVEGA